MARRKLKPTVDIEALAAKAKAEREAKCSEEVNAALTKRKCMLSVLVQVGDRAVPLASVLNLPLLLNVVSKGDA